MSYLKSDVLIASDHAGFALKSILIEELRNAKMQCHDLGCDSPEAVDYPKFANLLCNKMLHGNCFGVLICGSGIGMVIAANRFHHIRAALCDAQESAKLARAHNDANVIVFPARSLDAAKAFEILAVFMATPFEGGRHEPRVKQLGALPDGLLF